MILQRIDEGMNMYRATLCAAISALSVLVCAACAFWGIVMLIGSKPLDGVALWVATLLMAGVARAADHLKMRTLYGTNGMWLDSDSEKHTCSYLARRDLVMYRKLAKSVNYDRSHENVHTFHMQIANLWRRFRHQPLKYI